MSAIGEIDRRLANLINIGTIADVDEEKALVRVEIGGITTDWLPWLVARASHDRAWHAYEVGEQVLVLSPSGETSAGVVLGSIPQDAHPPAANSKEVTRYQWKDGAYQEYNRETHHYSLDVPNGGNITLHIGDTTLMLDGTSIAATVGASVLTLRASGCTLDTQTFAVNAQKSTFSGDVDVLGSVSVPNGDVVAGSISLKNHLHEKTAAHPTSKSGKPV